MPFTIEEHPSQTPNDRHFTVSITADRHTDFNRPNPTTLNITTTLTSDQATVTSWINDMRNQTRNLYDNNIGLVIGLDIINNLDIIQLFFYRQCLIFQLCHADRFPATLSFLLTDPHITFVGLSTYFFRDLLDDNHKIMLPPSMPLDLYYHIDNSYLDNNPSHDYAASEIGSRLLGVDLPPEVLQSESDMNNWDVPLPQLSIAHIGYACFKVYVPYNIALHLQAWRLNPNLLNLLPPNNNNNNNNGDGGGN